jgi:hypothetical protein
MTGGSGKRQNGSAVLTSMRSGRALPGWTWVLAPAPPLPRGWSLRLPLATTMVIRRPINAGSRGILSWGNADGGAPMHNLTDKQRRTPRWNWRSGKKSYGD